METFTAPSRKYLLGDWDGERTKLEEKGVTLDVFYVVDALSDVDGGRAQANTAWGRIRATTYRSLLRPWLTFQPDFQYIIHPGALNNSTIGNATVVGFRSKVTF